MTQMTIEEGFFPTSTHAVMGEMQNKIDRLSENLDTARARINSFETKIDNVRNYILDEYAMEGMLHTQLEEVANMLDITLTKKIQGEANIRITYTAEVPLNFDGNDFELSYEISCDSYEAENFEFDEEYFEYETGDED